MMLPCLIIPAGDTIYQFTLLRSRSQNSLDIRCFVNYQFVIARDRSLPTTRHADKKWIK